MARQEEGREAMAALKSDSEVIGWTVELAMLSLIFVVLF
jgi:hypothetical protein